MEDQSSRQKSLRFHPEREKHLSDYLNVFLRRWKIALVVFALALPASLFGHGYLRRARELLLARFRPDDASGTLMRGLLRLQDLVINTDVIVLSTPEIAGLPYVISGLVAAVFYMAAFIGWRPARCRPSTSTLAARKPSMLEKL